MDFKMRMLVGFFYINQNSRGRFYHFLIKYLYRIWSYWCLGIDLHPDVRVGKGLKVYHGTGLVVNPGVIIGDDVILRHGVTIGNYIKYDGIVTGVPVIGNRVEFGCGSVCLGEISVHDDCLLGANSVVTKNMPQGTSCLGVNCFRQRVI